MRLDQSVYPDCDSPPTSLRTPEDQADYLHRVCGLWDYGIVPEPDTFELLRGWQDVFDAFPMPHSAAYHALRSIFRWEPVEGRVLRPAYRIYDLKEGRSDPCEDCI